jgi:amino acid permease
MADIKELEHINLSLLSEEDPASVDPKVTSSNKLLYLLASPGRYISKKFSPGSLKGSTFTIFAATVGAGVLTLPYAVNLAGLYLGFVLFVLGYLVSYYTCQLLVVCAQECSVFSYEGIAAKVFGKRMGLFAEVNIFVNNYGTSIAYLVLVKDLPGHALELLDIGGSVVSNPYLWGVCLTVWGT